MKLDEYGLPRENGATDWQDSARLAGILNVFSIRYFNMLQYVTHDFKFKHHKRYVRHPYERKYDFSRDQAVCLMAGLYFTNNCNLVNKNFIDGKDWFSPSHNGHVRICQGLKPRWHQKLWLWLDVFWACYVKPMAEPNQLLCMLMVADIKYLTFYVRRNKKWKEAIQNYWCGWRNEPEIAEQMISKIRNRVFYGNLK